MKKALIVLLSVLCIVGTADDIVATTLFADGTTNTWTQADLVAALQLLNRKYHRDCDTVAGRTAWHGRLVQTVVATNGASLIKTERHEDGMEFKFEAPYIPPVVAVSNANARLKTTMTRGVPAALAEARLRREAEKAVVSNVTVAVVGNLVR